MSDSKKAVNYPAKMVELIVERYVAAGKEKGPLADAGREAVLLKLVEETGKTKRSLIAKLNSEGVYIKKGYVAKTGGKPETKGAIVSSIADLMEVDADTKLQGLETATKNALTTIRNFVTGAAATLDAGAEHAMACEAALTANGIEIPGATVETESESES